MRGVRKSMPDHPLSPGGETFALLDTSVLLPPRLSVRTKIILVSGNTRHLAVKDTQKLGIDVMKPGEFIDALLMAAKSRVGRALKKAVADLTDPPYTKEQLLAALRLHGAHKTAAHFAEQ